MTSEENREYQRKYRQEHKEKVKKWKSDNYRKHKDSISIANIEWRKNNPEKRKEQSKRYSKKHKTKLSKSAILWAKDNPEKVKEIQSRYYINNKHKFAERRANRRNAKHPEANKDMINTFYETRLRVSECIGIPHEVDHIFPISKGGLHHQNNLQVMPMTINRRKFNKTDLSVAILN